MKAMILAAGEGKRMRPLTLQTPKPLLEVASKPLIVWHIERLVNAGIKDIVINIAHLGQQIPQRLGDGSFWNINLYYSDEISQGGLETAGGIIKALPLLGDEPFWVINGDIWCDYEIDSSKKLRDGTLAHLLFVPNPPHNEHGDFDIDINGYALDNQAYTFSGIGLYSPKIFDGIEVGKKPLAPILKNAMSKHKITAEIFYGRWYDIGTPQRLKEINTLMSINACEFY
jgi:MurNAc alpha-1-phosphate uridylyltransferase